MNKSFDKIVSENEFHQETLELFNATNDFTGKIYIQQIIQRFELYSSAQILLNTPNGLYTKNLKKIFIHSLRISNVWAIYEGVYFLCEKVFISNFLRSNLGKGKLIEGYRIKEIKIYSDIEPLNNYFENQYKNSNRYNHNVGLIYLNNILKYVEMLKNENIRVYQTNNNKHLDDFLIQIRRVKEVKTLNYRKRRNRISLTKDEKKMKWKSFLTVIYTIRNHFNHNSLTPSSAIDSINEEKFRLKFILDLNNLFGDIVINIFFKELRKKLIS